MSKDSVKIEEIGEITDDELLRIIDLARLDPLAPGMGIQKAHLKNILAHFRVLNDVSLNGVDPTIQINHVPIPLRDDEPLDILTRNEALENARLKTKEFFLAPKILGGDDSGH